MWVYIYISLFSCSVISNSLWPCGLQLTRLPCPSPHPSWSLLRLTSIESVMPSSRLILCRPFLLPPSVFPSIRFFSSESVLHTRWPKYWGFSFNISPSNEYSRLIAFMMDWLDLLAIQGTLKSLLQHHSSETSITHTTKIYKIPPFFPELSLENLASVLMRRWCIYYKISMDVGVASVDPLCEWAYMLMSPATLKMGSKSIQNHCLEVILKPLFGEG